MTDPIRWDDPASQELKPCPFCGADGACHGEGYVGEYYGIVNCADCGGAMQVMPGTEAEAIAAWNTRPAPDMAGVVEALEWAIDTLQEINPSNYDHDDACSLNAASVEVSLGLQATLQSLRGQQ